MAPERRASTVSLLLSYGCERKGLPAASSLRRWTIAALTVANRSHAEVSLRIVDADEGLDLNRSYRGKDYATNVLSFAAEATPAAADFIGDIALCAPVIQAEAQSQGKLLRAHYAHLCIHGVLHLLGYDHQNPDDAGIMEALERNALASLGIADPYA